MFAAELVIGAALICLTVIIHAFALDRIMMTLERITPTMFRRFHRLWKVPVLVFAVLCVFCAHIIQIWIWAFFYLNMQALPTLEEALYFSTSTFTTVGFGDVVLGEKWRLISSFQAANGFMLFGWSTAFIFEIMSKLYKEDALRKTEKSHA